VKYNVLNETKHQYTIMYSVKTSFKNEGDMKTSLGKQKLGEFIASRPPWQEALRFFLERRKIM
jgi:hypothetical protein